MKDRIHNFVYFHDGNYSSYGDIKCLMICVCWFLSFISTVVAIVMKLWLFLAFPIVINCVYVLHLMLLRFFFKDSYALRFWSDGIVTMLLSILFLTTGYTILCATECDTTFVKYGTLLLYAAYVLLIVLLTIHRARSDKTQKRKQPKEKLAFFSALVPVSGVVGILAAKIFFQVLDFENKNQIAAYVVFIACIIISLLFAMGSFNFVKYYYCMKYHIRCDAEGKDWSPMLLPTSSPRSKDKSHKSKPCKKKRTSRGI